MPRAGASVEPPLSTGTRQFDPSTSPPQYRHSNIGLHRQNHVDWNCAVIIIELPLEAAPEIATDG
jgi:hypothetical protein